MISRTTGTTMIIQVVRRPMDFLASAVGLSDSQCGSSGPLWGGRGGGEGDDGGASVIEELLDEGGLDGEASWKSIRATSTEASGEFGR